MLFLALLGAAWYAKSERGEAETLIDCTMPNVAFDLSHWHMVGKKMHELVLALHHQGVAIVVIVLIHTSKEPRYCRTAVDGGVSPPAWLSRPDNIVNRSATVACRNV